MKSVRNKTIALSDEEALDYYSAIKQLNRQHSAEELNDSLIHQNLWEVMDYLPDAFVDLMVIDPPYNMNKRFGAMNFKKGSLEDYTAYLESFLPKLKRLLKPHATLYICGDWFSSTSIHQVASRLFQVHNRITWQREKGRGAKANWKNAHEDIWFCTNADQMTFNLEAVKLRRKVLAPYQENGKPKDWKQTDLGKFRDTSPSNFWDDITVPYWSMAENTEHPTQKPEKLLAKLILASSNEGDLVFDPFMGSGTTCVVAKKLKRHFLGLEIDQNYACVAQKRINDATLNAKIQGYTDGVFWERNTLPKSPNPPKKLNQR